MSPNQLTKALRALNSGDSILVDGRRHVKTLACNIPLYVDVTSGVNSTGPQLVERFARGRVEVVIAGAQPPVITAKDIADGAFVWGEERYGDRRQLLSGIEAVCAQTLESLNAEDVIDPNGTSHRIVITVSLEGEMAVQS